MKAELRSQAIKDKKDKRQKSDLVRKAPVVLRIRDVDSCDGVFELADGR
jgi:hypothetical protein